MSIILEANSVIYINGVSDQNLAPTIFFLKIEDFSLVALLLVNRITLKENAE